MDGLVMPLERPLMGCPPGQAGGVVFITVNQVLVRLWARRGRKSDRMWSVFRDGSSRDRGKCVQRRVLCAEQDDPVRDRSWAQALGFGRGLSLTTGD